MLIYRYAIPEEAEVLACTCDERLSLVGRVHRMDTAVQVLDQIRNQRSLFLVNKHINAEVSNFTSTLPILRILNSHCLDAWLCRSSLGEKRMIKRIVVEKEARKHMVFGLLSTAELRLSALRQLEQWFKRVEMIPLNNGGDHEAWIEMQFEIVESF